MRTREADPTRQALLGQLLRVVQVAGEQSTLAGQQMAQGLAGGSHLLEGLARMMSCSLCAVTALL